MNKMLNKIVKLGFTATLSGNEILVSAEDDTMAGEYYPCFQAIPWINPKLDDLASREGYFIDWQDPGTLVIIKD